MHQSQLALYWPALGLQAACVQLLRHAAAAATFAAAVLGLQHLCRLRISVWLGPLGFLGVLT
jgi:hypothetical protein